MKKLLAIFLGILSTYFIVFFVILMINYISDFLQFLSTVDIILIIGVILWAVLAYIFAIYKIAHLYSD